LAGKDGRAIAATGTVTADRAWTSFFDRKCRLLGFF
jgi:hypothetical protein